MDLDFEGISTTKLQTICIGELPTTTMRALTSLRRENITGLDVSGEIYNGN